MLPIQCPLLHTPILSEKALGSWTLRPGALAPQWVVNYLSGGRILSDLFSFPYLYVLFDYSRTVHMAERRTMESISLGGKGKQNKREKREAGRGSAVRGFGTEGWRAHPCVSEGSLWWCSRG